MKSVLKVAVIGIALTVLAAPAFARDVTLYGSARMATFYHNIDPPVGSADTDLDWRLQGNSRFGMRVADGAIGGLFELGTGTGGLIIRNLFGTYKTDAGTLLVGQAETPYFYLANSVVRDDSGMLGYGAPYTARRGQIRFTMTSGLYVAGMTPVGLPGAPPAGGSAAPRDNNILMPQLVVGFAQKAGSVDYNVGVTGLTYESGDDRVNAGMAYAILRFDLGAAKLAVSAHGGQNAGVFLAGRAVGVPVFTAGEWRDTTNYGATVDLNVAGVNVGVGYAADDPKDAARRDDKMTAYINYPIAVAKNFSITPEIAYFDEMKNAAGADERSEIYAGAKWQLNF